MMCLIIIIFIILKLNFIYLPKTTTKYIKYQIITLI